MQGCISPFRPSRLWETCARAAVSEEMRRAGKRINIDQCQPLGITLEGPTFPPQEQLDAATFQWPRSFSGAAHA